MAVKTRRYGRTGMFVPELSLGTANFGGQGHAPGNFGMDPDVACGQIALAMDRGVNLFDTADGYARGHSESVIGEAVKKLGLARRDFMISTKVGIATGPGVNHRGASRVHILEAITASLTRLSVDYVDIYHVHLPDRITPIEETVRALQDVVARGVCPLRGVLELAVLEGHEGHCDCVTTWLAAFRWRGVLLFPRRARHRT